MAIGQPANSGYNLSQAPTQNPNQVQASNELGQGGLTLLRQMQQQMAEQNRPRTWQENVGAGLSKIPQQGGFSGRNIGSALGGIAGGFSGPAAPIASPLAALLGGWAGSYFDESPEAMQQRQRMAQNEQYREQYAPIASEARREFDTNTLPGLEAQLFRSGPGMERGTSLERLRNQARTSLESKLAAGQAQNMLGWRGAENQEQQLRNQLLGLQQQGQYQQGMLGLRGQELGQNQQQSQQDLALRMILGSLGQQHENVFEEKGQKGIIESIGEAFQNINGTPGYRRGPEPTESQLAQMQRSRQDNMRKQLAFAQGERDFGEGRYSNRGQY